MTIPYTLRELVENRKYLARLYAFYIKQYPLDKIAKELRKEVYVIKKDLERLILTQGEWGKQEKKSKYETGDLFWDLGVLDELDVRVTEKDK